uniref:proline-rich protein HaeIII subfamily 1-like n=1 Tax=Nyctereutes procyonoides TaxID=34880 RepID=UPI00244429D8|nr:proline-rich protein HaeIII subfamily 1-like [Nyctereutes procyonoides]
MPPSTSPLPPPRIAARVGEARGTPGPAALQPGLPCQRRRGRPRPEGAPAPRVCDSSEHVVSGPGAPLPPVAVTGAPGDHTMLPGVRAPAPPPAPLPALAARQRRLAPHRTWNFRAPRAEAARTPPGRRRRPPRLQPTPRAPDRRPAGKDAPQPGREESGGSGPTPTPAPTHRKARGPPGAAHPARPGRRRRRPHAPEEPPQDPGTPGPYLLCGPGSARGDNSRLQIWRRVQ